MGNNLKKYREQKGITQSEFSRRVGVIKTNKKGVEITISESLIG